jgi:hypothetical protein
MWELDVGIGCGNRVWKGNRREQKGAERKGGV